MASIPACMRLGIADAAIETPMSFYKPRRAYPYSVECVRHTQTYAHVYLRLHPCMQLCAFINLYWSTKAGPERMRVFVDAVSGDEMFSDSFKFKLVDDVVYEVEGKYVIVSNKIDDSLLGANPSAEEENEALEEGSQRVIDLVHGMRLTYSPFDKKGYKDYLKVTGSFYVTNFAGLRPDHQEATYGTGS
ncbi:unnamed protein product [Echinostoma caproni]|uniref:TCTP domain-containing protein n=1 Tax=Echinostoma caproni TaxID=27848 RepID=A0A183BE73_9TREM|nr:unnamed protein product [Echinostoma caproni]